MNFEEVQKELSKKRQEMYNIYDRVLPTNELLFDRWEKAKMINAGENASIYDSSIIMGNVEVGANAWIGPWTLLDGSGGLLRIGNYCSISAGVQIYTHDTVEWALSGGKSERTTANTVIGNQCYIAPMCIISKGVSIGEKSVVAANSFVNKSFEPYSIIAGTPAKKIGEVIIENEKIELRYY